VLSRSAVAAEWRLARARLIRSRLGLWLALLAAGLAELGARAAVPDPAGLAARSGMMAAVLAVAFTAGSDADRAALPLTLTHPTTPLSLALGRWLGAVTVAALPMLAATTAVGIARSLSPLALLAANAGGLAAAGAAAACALALVWVGGNAGAGFLFLYIGVLSGLSPVGVRYLAPHGALPRAAEWMLALLPALWRYRVLAAGSAVAWLHAGLWITGGIALAAWRVSRR